MTVYSAYDTVKPANIAENPINFPCSGLWGNLLGPGLIIVTNLLLFHRSLRGYFLADDFVHIDYLNRVMQGNYLELLKNFTGNWMQAEGTTFYRPLISITLAADYLFSGANPLGYHISNLAYHTACAVALYLVGNLIFQGFLKEQENKTKPRLAGFLAAMLFSLYPLHCEVVNWVIARVDSVCLTFHLLAFYAFLQLQRKLKSEQSTGKTWFVCLVLFILSLMSKEMAVILPPLAALYLFFSLDAVSLPARIWQSLKRTAPLWAALLGYLGLRALFLHTLAGGYEGSIGSGLAKSLFKRWTDGSLIRILLPLNWDVFGGNNSLAKNLKTIYFLGIGNFIVYLTRSRKLSYLKMLVFTVGWFALALAPTYQVWNLTENLQGGRFLYFASAPLSLFLALLLAAPLLAPTPSGILKRSQSFLACILLTLLTLLFAQITRGNNQVWISAQKELMRFRQALSAEAAADSRKLAVLNLPQSYKGAHMLYNAATMSVMLKPPLSEQDLRERILTFEPATFGDSELIRPARVRQLIKQGGCRFFLWQRDKQELEPLQLTLPENTGSLNISPAAPLTVAPGERATLPELDLNPLAMDRIILNMDGEQARLTFTSDKGRTMEVLAPIDGKSKKLEVNLSERKGFLALEKIESLTVSPASGAITIYGATIPPLDKLPELAVDGKDFAMDNDGIARLKGSKPTFSYDVSFIPGAKSAMFELSKPNSWFEHYTGTFKDHNPSPEADISGQLNRPQGKNIPLSVTGVKGHGFFELRVVGLDQNHKPTGYFSEPLCFQL